jgi:hypothetical protein
MGEHKSAQDNVQQNSTSDLGAQPVQQRLRTLPSIHHGTVMLTGWLQSPNCWSSIQ